jgi:hypothetical protein
MEPIMIFYGTGVNIAITNFMSKSSIRTCMDEAFIIVSIISGLFGILGLELISHNWFKKERFKFEVSSLKKRQDLELKKMSRDMGLSSTPSLKNLAAPDNVGSLLNIAKNLSPDALGQIADIIQGRIGGGEGEGELLPEGLDGLLEFATKNPDIVKGFLTGLNKGKEGGSDGGFI